MSSALFASSALSAMPAVLCLAYPGLLHLASRRVRERGDAPTRSDLLPDRTSSVALVTVATRRDERLGRKLEGLTRLAGHPAVCEVLVGLDGDVPPRPSATPFRWIATAGRQGKNVVLGKIRAAARADILVFTDVDAEVAPAALEALLAPFADPGVGAVTGRRSIVDDTAFGRAQQGYGDLDSRVRALEMRVLRSVTSCDGKLYAIRRTCIDGALPEEVTDDLHTGLGAIAAGRRLVSAPGAVARIGRPARDVGHELERRRRVTCRGLATLWHRRALLNPRRYGVYALALAVNKLMRRLAGPGLLLCAVAFAAALLALPGAPAPPGGVASPAMAGALAGTFAGVIGLGAFLLSRGRGGSPGYLVLGLLGMTLGVVDYLRGKRIRRWESRKQDDGVRASASLDYLVSYYPKLTETFIVDEVEGLARSFDVTVHPILPDHPARPAAPGTSPGPMVVREHPLSPGILRDACLRIATAPRALLGPLPALLRGAARHPRVAGKSLLLLPKALALGHRMRRRSVQHLHAGFASYPATLAWMIARSADLPFSFVAHANDIFKNTFLLEEKVRDAAAVFAISQYNKRYLMQACPQAAADRIHVLPTGVEPDRHDFRIRPRPAPTCRLLSVGSLLEKKGHAVLCDAVASLRARGHDVRCTIVGEGPERVALERRIRELELGDAIELAGGQSRERVRERLDRADLFVLACVEAADRSADGIPVALMEAMASGLPVVSTRLRAIPELVEDGTSGLLCEPGDAAALARCIERLLEDDRLRRALATAARERIEDSFDQRRISSARCAILEDVIRRHRTAGSPSLAQGVGGER